MSGLCWPALTSPDSDWLSCVSDRLPPDALSEGSLLIQWEAKAGRVLQAKANLADPIWRDIPGTSGQGESRQALLGEAAYYRLVDP